MLKVLHEWISTRAGNLERSALAKADKSHGNGRSVKRLGEEMGLSQEPQVLPSRTRNYCHSPDFVVGEMSIAPVSDHNPNQMGRADFPAGTLAGHCKACFCLSRALRT